MSLSLVGAVIKIAASDAQTLGYIKTNTLISSNHLDTEAVNLDFVRSLSAKERQALRDIRRTDLPIAFYFIFVSC